MASNFGITVAQHSYGYCVKLEGDCAATSAYELINAISRILSGGDRG